MNRELLIWCLNHINLDDKIIIESNCIEKNDFKKFFEISGAKDFDKQVKYSVLIMDYSFVNLLFIHSNYENFDKFVLIENELIYDIEYLSKLTNKKAMILSCNKKIFTIME